MGGFSGPSGSTDPNAVHDNTGGEINAVAAKGSPVGADIILIEDSADGWNKKKATITSLPTGADANAIHDNVADEIHQVTDIAPTAIDEILIEDESDSWNKKRIQLGDIPSLAAPAAHTHVEVDITDLDHDDTDAIHDNVSGEINAIADKATKADADLVLIEDSAATYAKKKMTIANLLAGLIGSLVDDTSPQLGGDLQLDAYGKVLTLTAGASISTGDWCYLSSVDGKMELADADGEATSIGLIGVAMANIAEDATGLFKIAGVWVTSGLTPGATYYLSTTGGAITSTKPSGSGDIVRVVGYALSSTQLLIDVDQTYVEVT